MAMVEDGQGGVGVASRREVVEAVEAAAVIPFQRDVVWGLGWWYVVGSRFPVEGGQKPDRWIQIFEVLEGDEQRRAVMVEDDGERWRLEVWRRDVGAMFAAGPVRFRQLTGG